MILLQLKNFFPLRDRKEINFTVIEKENGSDLEDFCERGISYTSEQKSSRDESIFPSRTVKVISLRSLTSAAILFAVLQLTPLPFTPLSAEDAPVELIATYDHINSSKFKFPHSSRHHTLSFGEGTFLATYTYKLSSQLGLKYGIGYTRTKLGFTHRPHIEQKTFNNLLLSIGGSIKTQDKWLWDTNLYLQMNTEHLSLSRYTFFRGYLHGKYEWKEDINLHVGLEGVTGMHYTHIWPSVGFDYQYSPKIRFNAIFPSNVSAIYFFTERTSINASAHLFFTRQRLGINESDHLKRGLIAYRNVGLEIGFNYRIMDRILANVHIGEALGGRLRVSHRHDRKRHHYRQKAAPYFGLVACLAF